MSGSAKDQMPKTHHVEHAFSMKDRMDYLSIPIDNHHRSSFTNTHDRTTIQPDLRHFRLANDLISKIMKNDPSIMEKFFEKVVLRPPGIVGGGIRIMYSCDTNNNEPIRNNRNEIHHYDDPNIGSVNVADADAADGVKVVVVDGDDGKVADGDGNDGNKQESGVFRSVQETWIVHVSKVYGGVLNNFYTISSNNISNIHRTNIWIVVVMDLIAVVSDWFVVVSVTAMNNLIPPRTPPGGRSTTFSENFSMIEGSFFIILEIKSLSSLK
ncbi:hypothetical protein PIB30_020006 [Stylosanthes scabra]|uniref:Uncharacterized protein n=1 Tax=Stylosanthes scabra TaxID=79078 RepID=A0ABU6Q965_9FABA|nr:hypothetical protein [Stylosanthes scabra]